jgi:uncharacterized repeat protein (TIGR01451 family)
MSLQTLPRILSPLILLAMVALMGCESQGDQQTPRAQGEKRSRFIFWKEGEAGQAQDARKEATAGGKESGTPTPEEDPSAFLTVTSASLAYPTGVPKTSALLITKSVDSDVRIGKDFTYDIEVQNLTKMELRDVVVTETLGDNLVLKSSEPIAQTSVPGKASWNLGSLAPQAKKTIKVTGSPKGTGFVTTCSSVTYNSEVCVTSRVVDPKLKLTKSAPAEVLQCDGIPIKLVVSNIGTGTITGLNIEDPLAEGLATKEGRKAITLGVGILKEGQSREFDVVAMPSRTGTFKNSARATADGELTATSNETTTIVRLPVLALTKSGPAKKYIGQEFQYRLVVTNGGDGEARKTIVEDRIPANTTFVSASDGGRRSRGKVTWSLGTLEPKAFRNLTVTVRGKEAGTARNVASAEAYCAKKVEAEAVTEVVGIPAILMEVVDLTDPVQVGQETIYEITVTNQGSATGTNVRITCSFESSMQYLSTDGATSPMAANIGKPQVAMQPLAELAPGARASWKVRVKALTAGDVRFKVSMTSDQTTRPVQETEATYIYQ